MNAFKLFVLSLALAVSFGCGESEKMDDELTANFSADGFGVRAVQTSANTYQFTVAENTRYPNAVFTVYGLSDESEFNGFLTSSKMRLAHVVGSSSVGKTFEVTFNDNDTWFAIYHDDWNGFGWIYSTGRQMVKGEFRQ
jgi:hypothetical protein